MLIIYSLIIISSLACLVAIMKLSSNNLEKILVRVRNNRILDEIRKADINTNSEKSCNDFYIKKLRSFLISLCIGCMFALLYEVFMLNSNDLVNGIRIFRNGYSESDKNVSLKVRNTYTDEAEEINIVVNSKQYTDKQLQKLAKELEAILEKQVLGENKSLDQISTNMSFPNSVSGYPFSITWRTDNPLLINSKGEIDDNQLKKIGDLQDLNDGVLTGIHAELKFNNFIYKIDFFVCIYPPIVSSELSLAEYLSNEISEIDKETCTEDYLELPQYVEDVRLSYEKASDYKSCYIFLMTLIIAVTIYFKEDQELKRKLKDRTDELINEYPKMVNKFALFYSAGLTTRGIWSKLCKEYRSEIMNGEKKKYLYEEMLIIDAKLDEGLSEMAAYEEFAACIGIYRYRHFISIVEQSIDKGREDLLEQMESEAENAFLERKNRARKLGEEAGTKLLFPMMMMLIVVLIIVMFPAFISFRI